jgi:hypothetical protein
MEALTDLNPSQVTQGSVFPLYCFEVLLLSESGTMPAPYETEGAYRGYALRHGEAVCLMNWFGTLFKHHADRESSNMLVETYFDEEIGLESVVTECLDTDTSFLMRCRPLLAPAFPQGLFVFWGELLNPVTGESRSIQNLDEFVSQPLAQGKPVTKPEAMAALETLCTANQRDRTPYRRMFTETTDNGSINTVDLPEMADGEAVASFISSDLTIIIGYWPVTPRQEKES